ncbi:MAG: oligoendopeptidase F [Clostridiales bacterium]|nr:oligoendopeptidase F [Clostridiales bacterium]
MKTREQIEEKYKWDLTEYFKDDNEWKQTFESIKPMYEKLTTYEGKLSDSKSLLECLKLDKELDEIAARLSVYISLKVREDGKNSFYQNLSNQLDKYFNEISPRLSFITSELNELSDEHLTKLSKDKNFEDFDLTLKNFIRYKPHKLSKEEQKLMAMLSECIGGAGEVFDMLDAVDIKFEDVINSKGEKLPLNNSNYSVYVQSDDKTLRESAYKNLNGAYGKLNYVLAANYLNNVKTNSTLAKVSKFNSAFSASLFSEEVDESVYNTLVSQVNENLNVLYRYYDLKQKELGLKTFNNFDVNAELKTNVTKKYSYDEAFNLVATTMQIFGDEYVKVLNQAKNERWIDVMPNENKDTGAFAWGAYGAHPVVLLNFEGTNDSVFTLAHELGHMMHTYYSNKNNVSTKAGYEIFVAEVASTVNEMILAKTLLKNAKTKDEKLYYIDHLMNMFYGTVCRQTMFAEFEYNVHKAYENGEDVTTEAINNIYLSLAKKYFGEKVSLADEVKYEWSRIPHFYNSFYVYKYATGLISALAISNKILSGEQDAVENYKKFLASGCTKPPVELLKIAGADLTKKETFTQAFDFISSILNEWEVCSSKFSKKKTS